MSDTLEFKSFKSGLIFNLDDVIKNLCLQMYGCLISEFTIVDLRKKDITKRVAKIRKIYIMLPSKTRLQENSVISNKFKIIRNIATHATENGIQSQIEFVD